MSRYPYEELIGVALSGSVNFDRCRARRCASGSRSRWAARVVAYRGRGRRAAVSDQRWKHCHNSCERASYPRAVHRVSARLPQRRTAPRRCKPSRAVTRSVDLSLRLFRSVSPASAPAAAGRAAPVRSRPGGGQSRRDSSGRTATTLSTSARYVYITLRHHITLQCRTLQMDPSSTSVR